jgi:hypothetical protein
MVGRVSQNRGIMTSASGIKISSRNNRTVQRYGKVFAQIDLIVWRREGPMTDDILKLEV